MADRVVQEWRVRGAPLPLDAYPPYSFTWPRPSAARNGEDPDDGEADARAFWQSSVMGHPGAWAWAVLEHRTVTYTGWDDADAHGQEPADAAR